MYVFEEDVPDIARVGVYAFVPPENSVVLTQLTKSNPACHKPATLLASVGNIDDNFNIDHNIGNIGNNIDVK